MRQLWSTTFALVSLAVMPLAACGDEATGPADVSGQDTVLVPETTNDVGETSTPTDTTAPDTTPTDTTPTDTTPTDTAVEDTTVQDTTTQDTNVQDTAVEDTAVQDTSVQDTTVQDTTVQDTTTQDTTPGETADIVQPDDTDAQIQALIDVGAGATDPVTVDLLVEDAIVTMTKPATGSDQAGFFVQGDADGPAIFVVHEGAAPIVRNDIVTFRATSIDNVSGVVVVATFTDLDVAAGGGDADQLIQDVTGVDLATAYDGLQSEHVTFLAEVASDFTPAGNGFVSAQITTDGVTVASDNVKLRVPETLATSLALGRGCLVEVTRGTIWRFRNSAGTFSQTQPSVYEELDILAECDGPTLQSAAAGSATSVLLTFDKAVDPASITNAGAQFTISGGLTVSAAAASGNNVTLTTSAQTPGASYTVTIAATVKDGAGRPVTAPPAASAFTGFAGLAGLVINEIDYDQPSDDTAEFVELYNPTGSTVDLTGFALEMINGEEPDAVVVYQTHALTGSIAAGGYAIIASQTVVAAGGASVQRFTPAMNNIQNGARDGVRLVTAPGGVVVDAMLYEVPLNTVGAILTYAEGTAFVGGEANTDPNQSIARCANGADTGNNNVDFKLSGTPTPGAANVCP